MRLKLRRRKFCECGCERYVRNRFVSGHNRRKPKPKPKLCECGCGELAKPGRRYLSGHNSRGKHLSEEHKRKISCALIGSCASDYSKIRASETHKNKNVSKKTKDKMSKSHIGQVAWNKGLTKETSKRVTKNTESIKKGYAEWRSCWNIGLKKETDERLKKASNKQSKSAVKRMKFLQQTGKSYGKEGWYFSEKNNKEIYYRSSYELTAYKILEQLSKVKFYEVEPFAIQYEYDGFKRNTIPDILVVYMDGTKELIEVKSKDMLNDDRTSIKLEAMKNYSKENDWQFSVWTEKELFH